MAQFPVMEIVSGLVDIPRMCLLYMSFGGGHTVWASFGAGHTVWAL